MEAFADIKKTLAEGFKVENKGEGISHALLKILQKDETVGKHFTKLRGDSKRALFELVKAVGDNPDSKLAGRATTDYMIGEDKYNLVSNVWMEDTLYVSEEVTEEILARYFTEEKAAITRDTQAEIATVVVPKSEVKVEEKEAETVTFDLDNIDLDEYTGEKLKSLVAYMIEIDSPGMNVEEFVSKNTFKITSGPYENKDGQKIQIIIGTLSKVPVNGGYDDTLKVLQKFFEEGLHLN